MVKNLYGGKNKHHKKFADKKFIIKDIEQEYAIVTKMLGNCRLLAKSIDSLNEKLCIIRGSMRGKQSRISVGDVILISIRDYQDNKFDIIHKYESDDIRKLETLEKIKFNFDNTNDNNIDFETDIEHINPNDI